MLNEEVAKYRQLSGDNNPNTPISRIGGYLDGYERGLSERKKGKWIEGDRIIGWMCSECGYGVYPWNNTPYCPRCGSRMEGEQDG